MNKIRERASVCLSASVYLYLWTKGDGTDGAWDIDKHINCVWVCGFARASHENQRSWKKKFVSLQVERVSARLNVYFLSLLAQTTFDNETYSIWARWHEHDTHSHTTCDTDASIHHSRVRASDLFAPSSEVNACRQITWMMFSHFTQLNETFHNWNHQYLSRSLSIFRISVCIFR